MKRRPGKLDRVRIPEPCTVGWENMTGDDLIRHCAQCNKQVYNLSAMTRRRAEAIVATSRGGLCARIVKQPDGSVQTADDLLIALTSPPPARVRYTASVAGAVVSALLTISPAMAIPPQATGSPSTFVQSQDGQKKPQGKTEGTTGTISGTVIDAAKAVIAGAKVSLVHEQTGAIQSVISTSEDGTYKFAALQPETYRIKIEAVGFITSEVQNVAISQTLGCQVEVTMQVAGTIQGGAMASSPQPLRALYSDSDVIVVATVGKSMRVEREDDRSLMKTALHVSSTLTGKVKATVYVYRWVYKEEHGDFAKGNRLLLFLQPRESDDGKASGYEIDDESYGVKKLTEADLGVYKQRIAELARILRGAKPDRREIVEWLVRCAENPATRFEGAYELALGAEEVSDEEDEEVEESVEASEEAVPDPGEAEAEDEDHSYGELASLLSPGQKERLLNALYETAELGPRDDQLVRLARIWKDARLRPFLVAQLRRWQDAPPVFASSLVGTLALMLEDDVLTDLANDFDEVASDQLGAEEEESDPTDVSESEGEGEGPATAKERFDSPAGRQRRSEALKKFLAAVESKG